MIHESLQIAGETKRPRGNVEEGKVGARNNARTPARSCIGDPLAFINVDRTHEMIVSNCHQGGIGSRMEKIGLSEDKG